MKESPPGVGVEKPHSHIGIGAEGLTGPDDRKAATRKTDDAWPVFVDIRAGRDRDLAGHAVAEGVKPLGEQVTLTLGPDDYVAAIQKACDCWRMLASSDSRCEVDLASYR